MILKASGEAEARVIVAEAEATAVGKLTQAGVRWKSHNVSFGVEVHGFYEGDGKRQRQQSRLRPL